MRRRIAGLGAGVLAIVLSACSAFAGQPSAQGSPDDLASYYAQHITWSPCEGNHECTTVRVPLDYAAPGAASLTLPVRRLPATASPRQGTLFVDPGGPGVGSLGRGDWFDRSGLEAFDVVGWNPRGVATPSVNCGGLDSYVSRDRTPADTAQHAALVEADGQVAAACAALTDPGLLTNLSTQDAARDLDIMRAAMEESRLTYYGASYGSLLGNWYAHLFPDRVARMVLDAPVPLDRSDAAPQVVAAEINLRAFAAWCAARSCAWGDDQATVVREIDSWLRGLDEAPVPAGDRVLTQSSAVSGLWFGFYGGRAVWPDLVDALTTARKGDGSKLLRFADAATGRQADGRYDPMLAAGTAITCADWPVASIAQADAEWERARAAAPVMGEATGPDYVCAQWQAAQEAGSSPGAPTAAPILVLAMTGDAATPYSWAAKVVTELPSARLVTITKNGHVGYGSDACATKTTVEYLKKGSLPAAGTTCPG